MEIIFSLNKKNFNKNVILSTDDNSDYFFFSPIVSLIWNKYMDYNPIVIIVGNKNVWIKDPLRSLVMQTTLKNSDIVFIDTENLVKDRFFDGYNFSMISQVSRLCVSSLFEFNEYYLTSDIDMIPLNKKWFHQQKDKDIHIFYANGYNHKRYAICYIGMKLETWAKVMNLNVGLNIISTFKFLLSKLSPGAPDYYQWEYDETLFFDKIKRYPGYPDDCHMISRFTYKNPGYKKGQSVGVPEYLPFGRLDRSNWVFDGNLEGLFDAHCKRPGYKKENWEEIKFLLDKLLNKKDLDFINDYYKKFMGII